MNNNSSCGCSPNNTVNPITPVYTQTNNNQLAIPNAQDFYSANPTFDYFSAIASGTGTTNIKIGAGHSWDHYDITMSVLSSTYTASYNLDYINATPGSMLEITAFFPASTNPTIVIYDKVSMVSLASVTGTGTPFSQTFRFTWNGTHWELVPIGTTSGSGSNPTGPAGGSLTGTYPNPGLASSVNLPGSPTTTTPTTGDNSTKIPTTAFVAATLAAGIPPSGTAGGVLSGTYPNPGLASSISLPGSPTTTTQISSDNSLKIATTGFVQSVLGTQAPQGQCRLTFTNSSTVTLNLVNGNLLFINGVNQIIPSTPPVLSNSGLSNSTLYWCYAYINSGVMTLMASTTGRTQQSNGWWTMTGDSTKTFIGMVWVNSSGNFSFSQNALYTVSWFNSQLNISSTGSNSNSTTSGSFVETNSSQRSFFIWLNGNGNSDTGLITLNGTVNVNSSSGNPTVFYGMYLDGSSLTPMYEFDTPNSNQTYSANCASYQTLSTDSVHWINSGYQVSANTLTMKASVQMPIFV